MGSMTRVKNRLRALLAQQSEEIREKVSRERNIFGRKELVVLKGLDLPEGEEKNIGNSFSLSRQNLTMFTH